MVVAKTSKAVDLYSGSLACKVQLNELPSFRQYVAVQRKTTQNVVLSCSLFWVGNRNRP